MSKNGRLRIEFVRTGESIRVDGTCPHNPLIRFLGIATIHDPRSENPGITIPKPLGFRAVQAILDFHADLREKRRGALDH